MWQLRHPNPDLQRELRLERLEHLHRSGNLLSGRHPNRQQLRQLWRRHPNPHVQLGLRLGQLRLMRGRAQLQREPDLRLRRAMQFSRDSVLLSTAPNTD